MKTVEEPEEPSARAGRAVVLALVVGVGLIGAYFATGMPGMDHGEPTGRNGSTAAMDHDSMSFTHLDPDGFAARLDAGSAFVVNVHTPYAGEIDGTDAFIAYDQIAGDSRLPADKDADILLYCQSGRMSEIAADALVLAGYTNVVDLEGGMNAWRAAGMPVRGEPADASASGG